MKRSSNESIEFGRRLRKFRLDRNLGVAEVASSIAVATSTYREWEQGRAITGLPYVKLANAFGIGLHQLFGMNDPRAQVIEKLEEIERLVREIRLNF